MTCASMCMIFFLWGLRVGGGVARCMCVDGVKGISGESVV